MASTIRIDKDVKDEATRIASQLGISFNMVVNILLRRFNADKGFSFPVRLPDLHEKDVFDMTSAEFEQACELAVKERVANPQMDYVTQIDADSGQLIKNMQMGGRNMSYSELHGGPAPRILVLAGPNGSGKSTVTKRFLPLGYM